MMKYRRIQVSLIAMAFFFCGLKAQEKYDLTMNPNVGEEYRMESEIMTSGSESGQDFSMNFMVYSRSTVTEKTEETFTTNNLIDRVLMKMDMGMVQMNFDSDNPDPNDPFTASFQQEYDKIIGKEFKEIRDYKGVTQKSEGLDDQFGLGGGQSSLPENPVAIDEIWHQERDEDNMHMKMQSKLELVDETGYHIHTTGNIYTTGTDDKIGDLEIYRVLDLNTLMETEVVMEMNIDKDGTPVKVKIESKIEPNI